MLGEIQGKITGNRVLPSEGPTPKIESSYQGSGRILGVEVTDMGTFWSSSGRREYSTARDKGS